MTYSTDRATTFRLEIFYIIPCEKKIGKEMKLASLRNENRVISLCRSVLATN